MKKIAAMFMVLLLVVSFTGCIKEKPPVAEEKVVPREEVTPPVVEKAVPREEVTPPVAEEKVVPREEVTAEDPATQEIISDMAEIGVLEEDLNISDLENLESDLDAIVW